MPAARDVSAVDGFRMTPQRRAVLEALVACGNHPTAAEIFSRVQVTRPGTAYATVYNALHALVRRGFVRQLTFGDGASRYDARTDRHDHVLCVNCGTLVDVPAAPLSRAAVRAARESGFSLQGQHTQFYGLCPVCRLEQGNQTNETLN